MAAARHLLRSRASLAIVATAAWLGVPALADVKAGEDAWNRGDDAAAVQQWQGPAEQGDANAQFHLAQAYRLGRGVPRDLARAEQLFGKAAAQGHLEASDFYGLMLFDRGERSAALPYVRAAADRGDSRAQYLLGIAHFNGDLVPKDWTRAYALMILAQSAGLPQANAAMEQMNQHVPLPQRQAAATLAAKLGEQAEANRAAQVAATDLGGRIVPTTRPAPPLAPAPVGAHPATAPAPVPVPAPITAVAATPAPAPRRAPSPAKQPHPPAPAAAPWRVQLGAFGLPANADALWNRIKGRPELAGHGRINLKAGAVTKLQAGGFATREAAQAACTRLAGAGITCLVVPG